VAVIADSRSQFGINEDGVTWQQNIDKVRHDSLCRFQLTSKESRPLLHRESRGCQSRQEF
jgi:hypothetical protein